MSSCGNRGSCSDVDHIVEGTYEGIENKRQLDKELKDSLILVSKDARLVFIIQSEELIGVEVSIHP